MVDSSRQAGADEQEIEITSAMIAGGVKIMRETGALAQLGSSDALLVLRILEAALAVHAGVPRSLAAHSRAMKNAEQVGRRL